MLARAVVVVGGRVCRARLVAFWALPLSLTAQRILD